MTHVRSLLAGCLALALVSMVGAAGPSTQPSDVEKENAALRKRVAVLESQVKSLEDQVATLKRRERNFVIPPIPQRPAVPEVPQPPRFERIPPTPQTPGREWIPKQYDGRTFYIVPCTPTDDAAPLAR